MIRFAYYKNSEKGMGKVLCLAFSYYTVRGISKNNLLSNPIWIFKAEMKKNFIIFRNVQMTLNLLGIDAK